MENLLVFTHPVVAGGTTFSDFLDLYFWQHETVFAKNVTDQLTVAQLDTPLKRRNDRDASIIETFHRNKKLKLIRGHHHLAYNRRHLWVDRETKFITILRNPVSRFISHSHYLVVDLEILESLTKIPEIDFNLQTTYLSGCKSLCATHDDLEIAKKHLDVYDFIGITEYYDDSVKLFTRIFSLPYFGWRKNKYHVTKKKNAVPQEVKERIKELSHLDVELYEHAKALFKEKFEKYKNVRLIPPTRTDKFLMTLRKMDQYRAKGQRNIQGKLRKNFNQQSRLEEYLIN